MADLKTRLTLDGSDFQRGMDEASKSTENFEKKSKASASELLNQMKKMEGLGRSSSNYRSQLAQISKQIQDLTINYRQMNEEQKNSDFGRQVASTIDELTTKAAEYKDALMDAQASVKALASDTAGWDAMKMGIDTVSSSLQAFTSLGLVGEQTTERLVEVLARLKAMEVATNAVIKIGNTLQKQSALMMGIAKVQALALAKAKALEAAATKRATIAQRAFNIVAKANPYVLLATAVLTVVGALAAFTLGTEKDTEAQERHERELEEQERRYKSYSGSLGDVLYKYKLLQAQWKQLSDDMSKNSFIKEHKADFDSLGLSINDIGDAETVFVRKTADIVKAFQLRAKAAAYGSLAAEAYAKAILKEQQTQNNPKQSFKAMDQIPEGMYYDYKTEKAQREGLSKNARGVWYFTEKGAQAASEFNMQLNGVNKAYEEGDKLVQEQVNTLQEYDKALEELGLIASNLSQELSGTKVEPTKYEKGSVADYEAQIAALNKKLKDQKLTYKEIKDIMGEIAILEGRKTLASTGGLTPALKPITVSELPIKADEQKPISIPAEVHIINADDIKEAMFMDTKSTISGLTAVNSSVRSIYDNISNLGQAWDEQTSAIEKVTDVMGSILSVLQSITTIMETINTLQELFAVGKTITLMAEKKETEEKAKQLGIGAANLAIEQQEAVATSVKAAAEAGTSASKIPMVGWIVALGAIAAIVAAIAASKGALHFAKGGIVPGSSFSGDNISAQLNSGEMVLTTQQQRNLFNLLSNPGSQTSTGGQVEFTIKGQDLKGVLTNYDKKMSRL